eukprot:403338967
MDRFKAKQSVVLNPALEQKILNSDLAIATVNDNLATSPVKKLNPIEEKALKEQNLEEAKLLVKKINEEKREREKRRRELERQGQEKTQKEIDERQRKLEEDIQRMEDEKNRKRDMMEQKIKERQEQRQLSQQRMVFETKKLGKKPKMYQEIERKFTEEQMIQIEKERVEKLKEIKDVHKPINKDDIENHSRKYEDLMRQKKEELRKKRGFETQYESTDKLGKNYKSKFYEDIMNNEKEQKEQLTREKVERKKMQDKVGSYAKYVKEMYWPQVSEQKRMELESVKENLRHPIRRGNEEDNTMYSAPGGYQQRKPNIIRHGTADNRISYKNQAVAASVRNLHNNSRDDNTSQHSGNRNYNGFLSEPDNYLPPTEETQIKKKIQRRNLKPLMQNQNQPAQQDPNAKKPPKDYLREFKSKRNNDNNSKPAMLQMAAQDIEKVMSNSQLTDMEKYNMVKIKTDQLEKKANLEEQMMNVLGQNTNRNVDRTIEVNDMYIESIKAKLMMLDQI